MDYGQLEPNFAQLSPNLIGIIVLELLNKQDKLSCPKLRLNLMKLKGISEKCVCMNYDFIISQFMSN